ncbi:MAG: hypothetical protein N3B21_01010 [Clostridia bacterium]|nr:hypothetical protein [Clostridia bacterium]
MLSKDIYIYTSFNSWLKEEPDATIRGSVSNKYDSYIEILDESGLTQIINIEKVFAVVY